MATKGKNIVHKRLIRSYLTSVISISLVLVLVSGAILLIQSRRPHPDEQLFVNRPQEAASNPSK